LDPDEMPIRGNVQVAIAVPAGEDHPEQLAMYGLTPKGGWRFVGCDRQKIPGFVTGSYSRLGSFALRRDAKPPTATWMSPQALTSNRLPTFKLAVKDEISGFDDQSVNLEVDGQFVLMEYFPEAGTIFGTPDDPLSAGSHHVVLTLQDRCGNQTRIEKTIKVTGK
jgi:hypothetical protein